VVQVGAERALAGGDPLGRQAGGDPVQQPGAPGGQLGEPGVGVGLDPLRSRQRAQALGQAASGGIWRICAVIDYATKYCVAATVTPTSRGQDALSCLRRAVVEAERVLDLDDLRADRGVMDVVDADDYVIGEAPAPIAVVTDNGPCFRGVTFADAFAGDDPLFRHVRTRVRSPQTNGVVERFFGTLKYERLYRATSATATPSPSKSTCSATPTTLCDPTRPSTNAHHARLTSPSNTAVSVWPWRTRYLTGRS
jgi:transposase InsO family protein